MIAEHGVTLLGAKSLTESVLVHADTLGVSLTEESVEEGGGDPGFEDLPAANVGANNGAARVGGERDGSESCNSEGFHFIQILLIINLNHI